MKRRLLPAILAMTAVTFSATPAVAATKKQPAETVKAPAASEPPLAVVNGVVIPARQAQLMLSDRLATEGSDGPEASNAIRSQLVLRTLLVQQAKAKQLDKNPALIERQRMMSDELLVQAYRQDFFRTHVPDEVALVQAYAALKARAGEREFRLHYLLQESEDAAKATIERLRSRENFADIARQSKDPAIQKSGGDLGWVSPLNLAPHVFDTVLGRTRPGVIDLPIKGPAGWHVVQVDEIRPFVMPPLEGNMRQQLVNELTRKAFDVHVSELVKAAKIQ